MKELIKVEYSNNNPRISGRELHTFLEVKAHYKDWFPRMCEYGFEKGKDFNPLKKEQVRIEGGRPVKRTITDHELTLDMAKEISMLQRTDKGKQARQYFIAVEKKAREMFSAPKTKLEALKLAVELEEKLLEQQPKVVFAETCLKSKDSILVRELAKIACTEGIEIGEKRLFVQLRKWGLLMASNEPYQSQVDQGHFVVEQKPYDTPSGTRLAHTTKVTPKGQAYIINRLKKA